MKKVPLLLLLLTFSAPAFAQAYVYDTGNLPYTARIPINQGYIDVDNGEIHLDIPLATTKELGRIPLHESLEYDSRIWQIIYQNGAYVWSPGNISDSDGGWRVSTGLRVNGVTNQPTYATTVEAWTSCNGQEYPSEYAYTHFAWTDPVGTHHLFPESFYQQAPTPCNPNVDPSSAGGTALDGSGYSMSSTYDQSTNAVDTVVYDREGNEVYPTLKDLNGNAYSEDSNGNLVDPIGRTPVEESTSGNQIYFDVLTYGGARSRYTITTEHVYFHTAFQQSGVTELSGYITAIQSIQLPDGSTYSFTYDSGTSAGHYGDLTSITLPSGGIIDLSYGVFTDSYSNENRWLEEVDGSDGAWLLHPQVLSNCSSGNGCQEQTEVIGPDNNSTVYTFSLDPTTYSNNRSWNTAVKMYQGSPENGGSELKSIETSYTYNTEQFDNADGTVSIYELPQQLTEITSLYSSSTTLTAKKITSLDSIGANPLEIQNWDYNAANPIEKIYNYHNPFNGGYFPSEIEDKEPLGNNTTAILSDTQIGYDSYANVTSVSKWLNTDNSYQNTSATYDGNGQVQSVTGVNGTTYFGYDPYDMNVTTLTLPTPSSGVGMQYHLTYDFSTDLLSSTSDPNGKLTGYNNYDAFGRVGEIDYPDGGKTAFTYATRQANIYQYQDSNTYKNTVILYDFYGRKQRVAVANYQSTNPWYMTDICYDSDGRVGFQSYRYQGASLDSPEVCSGAGDTFSYDALSRPLHVAHEDGTGVTYSYQLRATEVTDENGASRIIQKDGYGRPTAICEISSNGSMPGSGSPAPCGLDIGGTGFLTSLSYNDPAFRVDVTQGVQTRSFMTDSLGRPVFSQEPESGQTTFSYLYNSTGLQVTRTRPKANQTSSGVTTTSVTQYDTLGRPVSITYSDGTPNKTFTYDVGQEWGIALQNPIGRLVAMATSANTGAIFGYDAMGRVTLRDQCTPSNCGTGYFPTAYTYDWAGNLLTASDGMGVTDTYTYSPANEVLSITSSRNDSNDPPNIVSSVQNGPFGPISWELGNGESGVRQYDSMGRVVGGWVCQGSTQPDCSGGTQVYGFTDGWKGSYMTSACDTVLNSCDNYSYDEFGRLSSMNTYQGSQPSYAYVYDRWGNRWEQNLISGSGPAPQLSFNTGNNEITNTGYAYDAAGDVTADGSHTYSYDAEGNLTQIDGGSTATFTFDAENERVRRDIPGKPSNEYIFNPFGNRSSVWDATNGWTSKGQTYWGSVPVELYNGGSAHYQNQDWLGTERMTTDHTGGVEGSYTSLPFGDGFHVTGSDPDQYHFAGLDYEYKVGSNGGALAHFRMYYNTAGRWISPDPSSGSYDFTSPQSYDRYSYVANNPLSVTDPQGLGEGGCGWICQIPPIDIICAIFCHFGGGGGGPSFHGTLKPRPNAQPWDEYHIHYGANIAAALGLPDETCDFGACGPPATMGLTPGGAAVEAQSSFTYNSSMFQLGAIWIYQTFREMERANVKRDDKFFHCTAMARATSLGPGGETAATTVSWGREITDTFKYRWYLITGNPHGLNFRDSIADSREDLKADYAGINGGLSGCTQYKVRGLP